MKEFNIENQMVVFTNKEDVTEDIAKNFLTYANEHKLDKKATVQKVTVTMDGKESDISVEFVQNKPKIERIRRITGYISGTLDTWNDAKREEEKARVKHF